MSGAIKKRPTPFFSFNGSTSVEPLKFVFIFAPPPCTLSLLKGGLGGGFCVFFVFLRFNQKPDASDFVAQDVAGFGVKIIVIKWPAFVNQLF